MLFRTLVASVLVISMVAPIGAVAQSAREQTPATAPATPGDDMILLKDGSMVRGTIEEIVASDRVVIMTRSGERRTYSMSEVTYAGPASSAPTAAPPSTPAPTPAPAPAAPERPRELVTVIGREARLQLRANKPTVTFHRKSATAMSNTYTNIRATGWDVMCTAPCEVSMPEGTYSLAISEGDEAPGEAAPVTIPPGVSMVYGEYENNSGLRTAVAVGGWVLAGAGVFVAIKSVNNKEEEECVGDYCQTHEAFDSSLFIVGAAMMLVGAGVATFGPPAIKDKGKIRVVPGSPAPPRPGSGDTQARLWDPLFGARLGGRF